MTKMQRLGFLEHMLLFAVGTLHFGRVKVKLYSGPWGTHILTCLLPFKTFGITFPGIYIKQSTHILNHLHHAVIC